MAIRRVSMARFFPGQEEMPIVMGLKRSAQDFLSRNQKHEGFISRKMGRLPSEKGM